MARPSKLTQELIENVKQYIEDCVSGHVIKIIDDTDKDGNPTVRKEVVYEVNLPTIEGLAYELNIHKDTIYDWRKGESDLHIEFSYLIERLLAKQAKYLVNNGLAGTYNSTISKVLLTKHGYREGSDITTNDKDINTLKGVEKELINNAFNQI